MLLLQNISTFGFATENLSKLRHLVGLLLRKSNLILHLNHYKLRCLGKNLKNKILETEFLRMKTPASLLSAFYKHVTSLEGLDTKVTTLFSTHTTLKWHENMPVWAFKRQAQ